MALYAGAASMVYSYLTQLIQDVSVSFLSSYSSSDDSEDDLGLSNLTINSDASDETEAAELARNQGKPSFLFERIVSNSGYPDHNINTPSTPISTPRKKCGAITRSNRPCNNRPAKGQILCRYHSLNEISPTPQPTSHPVVNDGKVLCTIAPVLFYLILFQNTLNLLARRTTYSHLFRQARPMATSSMFKWTALDFPICGT